jgi:hypothetical protein
MYRIAFFIVFIIASHLPAQNNYEKGMDKALDLWEKQKTEDAVNLFERIASAETDNWLPPYYAAQVLVLDGFSILNEKEKLETQLKRAQSFIDDATSISKDNPEIMILQALLHTVYVASDGATYGMILSGKIIMLYNKAKIIDPTNPRVLLNKAEWDIGSAKYFGQDTAPFCKDIEKAVELFANFKPETKFHPNWGKERAEAVLKTCKAN